MLENEKQIHISSVVLEYQELVNSLFGPYIGHSCTNETKGYKSKPDSSILNIIRKCTTQPIIQLLAEYLKKNSQLTGNFTGFLTIIFYPHIIQFLKAFNSRLTILINKDNYIHTHKSLVFYKCYEKLKLMPIEPLELTNDVIDFLESILGFIQNELHTISHMLCGNSDLESVKIARCSIYACFDIYGYISTIIGNSLSASMTNEQAIDITSYLTEEHVIYINKAVVRITTICTEKTWVDPDFISSMWFNHTVSHYINMWMTLIDITSHVIDDNPKFVTNCFNVIDTDIKIYLEFWSLSQPAILHAVIKILFILLNHCNDRLEALNTKLINGMNENMMKIIAIIIFYSKTIGNMMTTVCKYINDNILFHGYLAIPVTHLLIKTVKMSRSSNCSEFDSIDNLKLFNICFLALENLLTIYLFNFNYHNDTSRLINDFRHIYMILIEESGGESHFQIFMLRLFLNKILEENNLLVLDSNIIGIVCEIIESITSNKVPIDRMNSNFFPDLSSEHTGKLQSNIINYLTFPCDLFTLLIISLLKNSFYCNCLITLLFAWSKSCSPLHMLLSEVIWRSLGEFYSRNYNDSSYIIILDALLILCLESDAETYFNIESELEKFISLQLVLPPSQQHLFACLKQFLSSFDIRHPVADLLLRDVIMPYMNSIRQSLRPIISDHVYDNIGIDKEEICHHKQHKSIFHISFISSNADNDGCMSEMDRFLINKTNHWSNHAIKYGPSFTLFLNLYRSIPNGWFQAILLNIDQSDSDLDNLEGTISSYVDSLDNGSTIGTRKYIACIAKTVNALFVTIADYIKTLYQNGNYQKTIVLLCLCNQLLLAQSEIYPKIFIFDTKQLIFYFAILGSEECFLSNINFKLYPSLLSSSLIALTRIINTLDIKDTFPLTHVQECIVEIFFSSIGTFVNVYPGILEDFYLILSFRDTPLIMVIIKHIEKAALSIYEIMNPGYRAVALYGLLKFWIENIEKSQFKSKTMEYILSEYIRNSYTGDIRSANELFMEYTNRVDVCGNLLGKYGQGDKKHKMERLLSASEDCLDNMMDVGEFDLTQLPKLKCLINEALYIVQNYRRYLHNIE